MPIRCGAIFKNYCIANLSMNLLVHPTLNYRHLHADMMEVFKIAYSCYHVMTQKLT